MEKHVLSKSTFIRGVQCLKSLYLNKKRSFLRDRLPKERLIVFRRGHKVGELAQDLFPGGINMSPGHPAAFRKAIINTQQKIREGFPVIYEAAFQHDGVMIFLDILVHSGSGWHAYEVKSSGSISDTYLMDAALQYFVMQGTGLELSGISLIHINREYIRNGEIRPDELFSTVDVTADALSRQEYIKEQIVKEKEALNLPHSPKIPVGPHCREPYDCDFIGHCWKNEPKPEEKGSVDHFDKGLVKSTVKDAGTIAFLKLLAMRQAIPQYDGTHPYQEIPYGYSLSANGDNSYSIFTHESNPEPELKSALKQQLANINTIITFGQGYLCSKLLPENIRIIDMIDMVRMDSELRNINDGDSLLGMILSLTGPGNAASTYTSDAVCTHYYLEDFESAEVKAAIEEYALKWADAIKGLFEFWKLEFV